jgi:hypothetical protein
MGDYFDDALSQSARRSEVALATVADLPMWRRIARRGDFFNNGSRQVVSQFDCGERLF